MDYPDLFVNFQKIIELKMKALAILALLLPLALTLDCPTTSEIPVMDERTQKYTSALVYQVTP
jgi:hypothetical protein